MIGQICNANFHPCDDVRMTSQEIWLFATGELGNQSNKIFCDLTRHMIYISEYKHTLVSFHLRSYENKKSYVFQLYFSDIILAVNLGT